MKIYDFLLTQIKKIIEQLFNLIKFHTESAIYFLKLIGLVTLTQISTKVRYDTTLKNKLHLAYNETKHTFTNIKEYMLKQNNNLTNIIHS